MITIQLTDNATALLARVHAMPALVTTAICAALDYENELTIGAIKQNRLSFPKAGPTTLAGLREISGRLKRSVNRTRATVVGGAMVTSSIGSNVVYAGIHEFGGSISRTSKPGTIRLRADAKGNLLRNSRNGAIFAGKQHKRVTTRTYAGGKTFTIDIPERSYIRTAIADRAEQYRQSLSRAVLVAWEGR